MSVNRAQVCPKLGTDFAVLGEGTEGACRMADKAPKGTDCIDSRREKQSLLDQPT